MKYFRIMINFSTVKIWCLFLIVPLLKVNGLTFVEGGEPQDLLDSRSPSYIDYFWVRLGLP